MEAALARLSLFMSKCHNVGDHRSRLINILHYYRWQLPSDQMLVSGVTQFPLQCAITY